MQSSHACGGKGMFGGSKVAFAVGVKESQELLVLAPQPIRSLRALL